MSRSGYIDDMDDRWAFICWRGAVNSAIKGRRGQAFLKEMLAALDALPEKKLIAKKLEEDGAVCAIGAVGKTRGIDMTEIDPEDKEQIAAAFGISPAMAAEIAFMNDEAWGYYGGLSHEARFMKMREWIQSKILS
jgi:hypothetical protein